MEGSPQCLNSHGPETPPVSKPLIIASLITGSFCAIEIAGGFWARSLALLADAAHTGIDLIALGGALFAQAASVRPPDIRRTFGYKRMEVLAALGNGVALLVVTGMILREAFLRLLAPHDVYGPGMLAVALLGLAANLGSGFILFAPSRTNINMRGAFLHVASDALGSMAALVASCAIIWWHVPKADPMASIAISIGIVATALWLLKDSFHILLEGAPGHLDIEEIRRALASFQGVREVHDLHLWSLSPGNEAMSGHLVVEKGRDTDAILTLAARLLDQRFKIRHATLQIEGSPDGAKEVK